MDPFLVSRWLTSSSPVAQPDIENASPSAVVGISFLIVVAPLEDSLCCRTPDDLGEVRDQDLAGVDQLFAE
jgi:hypothetical protein